MAAEIHLHEGLAALVRSDPSVSPDGRGRFVLLELPPHQSAPQSLPDFLFRLQAAGTTPVIVVRDGTSPSAPTPRWRARGSSGERCCR